MEELSKNNECFWYQLGTSGCTKSIGRLQGDLQEIKVSGQKIISIGRKHVLRCFHPFRTLSTGTWKENASQLLDVENAETALYLLEQFFGLTNLSKLLLPGLLLSSSSSPEQIQFP